MLKCTLILTTSLAFLFTMPDASAADSFLEAGKSYSISYLADRNIVNNNSLPLMVTIMKRGEGNWYLIKRADGINDQFWINFDLVVTVRPME